MEWLHNSLRCVEGFRKASSRTGLKDEGKIATERTIGKTNLLVQSPSPASFLLSVPDATAQTAVAQECPSSCTDSMCPLLSFPMRQSTSPDMSSGSTAPGQFSVGGRQISNDSLITRPDRWHWVSKTLSTNKAKSDESFFKFVRCST